MMKKEDYILSAQALFDYICGYFGYDWDEVMNRKNLSGTLGEIRVKHEMFDVYKHIQAGDGFLAWQNGVDILKSIINGWENWKTADDIRRHAQFLYDAAGFLDAYENVKQEDRQDWLTKLRSMRLLTAEEKLQDDLPEKCPRSMVDDIATVVNSNRLLRIARYRGSEPLRPDNISHINVGENFILAENVGSLMMQGKDGRDDELNVYVALNIDRVLDFSYFLIAFNNGDNWWLVTDEPEFANPAAKTGIAGRGAGRYRENDFDNTIFPYIYIDRIEEWRVKNHQIDKTGAEKREMYTVPLVEWPVVCRVYLNLLIERIIERLAADNGSLVQMKFGYEFTHALLLENKTVGHDDWKNHNEGFAYEDMNENSRRRIENMIIRNEKETSLVVTDAARIADAVSVWNGSLMTAEKFRGLESWAICNAEYEHRRQMLNISDDERKADQRKMAEMLGQNIRNRIDTLFAAKNMYVFIYEPDIIYKDEGSFNHYQTPYITEVHTAKVGWYIEVPGSVGGNSGEFCPHCGKRELKEHHKSGLKITHYAMLAWLAGVKREELPYWYINYRSFQFDSYVGNHLLSNINPMYSLSDPCSKKHRNGFDIDIILCRHCRTALGKKAMDKAILVVNSVTCQSEGLFDVDGFNAFLKEKGVGKCRQIEYI